VVDEGEEVMKLNPKIMVDPYFKATVKRTVKWMNTQACYSKTSYVFNPYKLHSPEQWADKLKGLRESKHLETLFERYRA
jgi:hypothetical protein